MQTNLAYIDDVMDRAVARRADKTLPIPAAERESAHKSGMRTVAGFKVFDEEAEKKALDEMIAKRRAGIDAFINDRKAVREKLGAFGITPMAVLPTVAWEKICDATKLFRLAPDTSGRVGINRAAFEKYPLPGKRKYGPLPADDPLDVAARTVGGWSVLLLALFPDFRSVPDPGYGYGSARPQTLTVLLPQPPDDVAAILLKAAKGSIPMKVAAVAEAIGFKEDLKTVRAGTAKHYADEERRIQALRNEPFIYTEQGTASAILAQFGDFPIEKEVVDLIVERDDIIPEKEPETSIGSYTTLSTLVLPDDVRMAYLQQEAIRQQMMMMTERTRRSTVDRYLWNT